MDRRKKPASFAYDSQGTELFAEIAGDGADVVLLHPTPVDHTFWTPIAMQLSHQYRVILPDLRGHGRSEAGAGIISIARMGEDIERLLDALEVEKALFGGCSIGSYILYELWRRIPGRVRALGFCCGKPQPDSEAHRAKRKRDIETIQREGTSAFFDQMINTLVGPTCRNREPAKAASLRKSMDTMRPESVIAVQQGLSQRPDSVPTLPTISVPVLALAGGEDPAGTPEEMKAIPEGCPRAQFHLLPDSGHYAPYERPEIVGGILQRFFESAL